MQEKERMARYLDENAEIYYALSDQIWDFAEIAFEEKHSAALQIDFLAQNGFVITKGIGGIPTAFTAEYRAGDPAQASIVGIAGEYDALPNMSQKADMPRREPLVEGGSGHACGHHLLGTAGVAAAVALKQVLAEGPRPGIIRYYGCPAEEGFSGKSFMVRAGAFDDLDIALSWHPQQYHCVEKSGALANIRLRYRFLGVSANPAHSAHLGRSALDAAELMNVGANYLREHMTSDARLHYAYEDAGGKAANVIPAKVEVNYCIRAAKMRTVMALKERLDKIAQGAALMTETAVSARMLSAYADYVGNQIVEERLAENLQAYLPLFYTEEELAYAARFRAATSEANIESAGRVLQQLLGLKGEALRKELQKPICDRYLPGMPSDGSTDFGDVSHIVPAGQIYTACFTLGAPPHSWQAAAVGKSAIAHHGELLAAKVLAATAWDFLADPNLIALAKAEFSEEFAENPYESPLPADAQPGGGLKIAGKQ